MAAPKITASSTIEIVPALGNYDGFFEVVGVKKPGGGGCWCMSYRDARVSNAERPLYMQRECATEPGPGVLAYVDGEPAGWCSVAPRSTYRRLMNSRTIPFLDERDAWSIVCFVVRSGYRRQGLMHHLLDGAVEHARAHGAEVVEGYPAQLLSDGPGGDRVDVISGYVGTTDLFEAHGFERAAETTAHSGGRVRWIMRREF
jgi:GNAT superfamily N-acetyltransferase